MNITVYLGSSGENNARIAECTRQLGAWIGSNGHTLVYGGSKTGLMGVLCDSVLANGGRVIGVIPDVPMILERIHPFLTEQIMVEDMAERRKSMIQLGDAFIALPGGIGTLDEITEVITLMRLEQLSAPCVMLGPDGFWLPFRKMCDEMEKNGLLPGNLTHQVFFTDSVEKAARKIESAGCV